MRIARGRGARKNGERYRVVRRNPIPAFIAVVAIIGLGCAYAYFSFSQTDRYRASRHVLAEKSTIDLRMTVDYERGPIAREDYRMSDDDGISATSYRVLGRGGTEVTVTERPRATLEQGANVADLFGRVVQDGIWELHARPPRGDTTTRYTIAIAQVAGAAHGSYRFSFTDPHYWATTGGHQFHIVLAKGKPLPDLLQLSSTTLVEPRYGRLVEDLRSFGPPAFRAKMLVARERAGGRG